MIPVRIVELDFFLFLTSYRLELIQMLVALRLADLLGNELSVQNDQLKAAFERLEQLSNSNESEYLSRVLQLPSDPNFHLEVHTQVQQVD